MTTFPELRGDYLAAKKIGLSRPRFSMAEADVIFAHIDAQAAEIERLREALEQIASQPHAPDAYIVASAALEQTK